MHVPWVHPCQCFRTSLCIQVHPVYPLLAAPPWAPCMGQLAAGLHASHCTSSPAVHSVSTNRAFMKRCGRSRAYSLLYANLPMCTPKCMLAHITECFGTVTKCGDMQAVNSLDGSILDDYTLTKPSTWSANYTSQTATMSSFVGNFTSTWYETYGMCTHPAASSEFFCHCWLSQKCKLGVHFAIEK